MRFRAAAFPRGFQRSGREKFIRRVIDTELVEILLKWGLGKDAEPGVATTMRSRSL